MSEQQQKVVLAGWSKDRDTARTTYPTGCPRCPAGNDKLKPTFRGRYCTGCGWMEGDDDA